jgi:hypothetical protein
MSFVSLIINYKLRPTYRRIGVSAGEKIADAVNADEKRRQKIVNVSAKTASVGLSLGCSILTADAAGFLHAVATAANTTSAMSSFNSLDTAGSLSAAIHRE